MVQGMQHSSAIAAMGPILDANGAIDDRELRFLAREGVPAGEIGAVEQRRRPQRTSFHIAEENLEPGGRLEHERRRRAFPGKRKIELAFRFQVHVPAVDLFLQLE